MPVNKELVADFALNFYSAGSFDDAFDTYYKLIRDAGFDGVLYSYIPNISVASRLSIPPFFKASEKYLDFLAYYSENRLDQHDFIIDAMKKGDGYVMDWWEEAKKRKIKTSEKEVLIVAKEKYGINNGITIPTLAEQRGIAGAAIISSLEGKDFETLKKDNIETVVLCTKMFHTFTLSSPLSSNSFILPFFPNLTEKEILVLRFQLTGKPMKTIEDSTGITPKYAEKLLINIRRKFGNISKNELIHQTSAFNILDDPNL